jgi:hypothetical protein
MREGEGEAGGEGGERQRIRGAGLQGNERGRQNRELRTYVDSISNSLCWFMSLICDLCFSCPGPSPLHFPGSPSIQENSSENSPLGPKGGESGSQEKGGNCRRLEELRGKGCVKGAVSSRRRYFRFFYLFLLLCLVKYPHNLTGKKLQ